MGTVRIIRDCLARCRAEIPRQFGRDDGLLGQASVEAKPLTIDDVPDGYLVFGSALGRDKPGGSAIALVQVDGDVPDSVLARIQGIPGVKAAKSLKF